MLSVQSIFIKNGHAPHWKDENNGYSLNLYASTKRIKKYQFLPPYEIHLPPPLDPADTTQSHIKQKTSTFTITVPLQEEITRIEIRSPADATIYQALT